MKIKNTKREMKKRSKKRRGGGMGVGGGGETNLNVRFLTTKGCCF